MRQDVTVIDGLAFPLLEAHADHGLGVLWHPDHILNCRWGQRHSAYRDHFEGIHVNVEGMAFGPSVLRVGNLDVPLLAGIQFRILGDVKLAIKLVIDHEVDANHWILYTRERAAEDEQSRSLDFAGLD